MSALVLHKISASLVLIGFFLYRIIARDKYPEGEAMYFIGQTGRAVCGLGVLCFIPSIIYWLWA